jgi:uncharacterized protein (TIGR02099 family)
MEIKPRTPSPAYREDQLPPNAAAPGTGLHRLGSALWKLLVLLVVLLAIYVSAGRYLMANIGALRPALLAQLNERLPFGIEVQRVEGAWEAFSPRFRFTELLITQPGSDAAPVRVGRGELTLDIPGSVVAGSLQLSELSLSGLALRARLTAEGGIEVEGFETRNPGALQAWLTDFLPRVRRLSLLDNALTLVDANAERELVLDLSLTRDGNQRIVSARVSGDTLSLQAQASGLGNPLRPLSWTGDVYLDLASDDLADLSSLWSSLDWPFTLSGSARAEFWLTRAGGDSRATMRMDGTAVRVEEQSGAWSLPLDALAFEAALSQQRNHWTLLAEDFHAERGDRALDLDRVQFDWWGRSLRIRGSALGLDSLPTLLAAAPGIPSGLRDALPELAPRGRLQRVELRLDDLSAPAVSWSLRGMLDAVAVGSWRGVPGIEGVSGYFTLAPGKGALQLDARDFAMHFPKIYRQPLRYESLVAALQLQWDEVDLRLQSGLIRARGEEGEVHALLAVDLPFSDRVTGPEMELLAGLKGARAQDRKKYIPYTLPDPLLAWLERSIVSGDVGQAGFIWRGSLRRGNNPHRSLQLFVDARAAELRFDPAWPAVTGLDALVRVDDGRTWATASSARIYDTRLDGLRVRVLPRPGAAQLSIQSELAGNASDGQRLLVESPLATLTDDVFRDWVLSGPVAGTLALELQLGAAPPPPAVTLDLGLDGVSATVPPLDLPLEKLRGRLRYRSDLGFSGSALRGELWGRDIAAEALDASGNEIAVSLSAELATGRLADWLQQPLLGFVSGNTSVQGALRLAPGEVGRLTLEGSLEGVTFDAPQPFAKTARRPLPLSLAMTLQAQPTLTLSFGERLSAQLEFTEGGLHRLVAVLGGGEAGMCDARYCLFGAVSTLDLAAWQAFGQRYLGPADEAGTSPGAAQGYRVHSLAVGELSYGERRLGQARVDVWGRGAQWQGSVESSALQGALTREDGQLRLLLEYLDVSQFDGGERPAVRELSALLPSLRVDVLDLRSGERSLGFLGFELDSAQTDGGLYIADITGELWGVDLAAGQPGLLVWRPLPGPAAEGEEREETALELDLAFADLGESLLQMGYARSLESSTGSGALSLRWPGSPADYAAPASRGTVRLDLREGRFLEARPGALAVVRILNLAEILRGLSLNQVFESGIPFDQATADLRFEGGVLAVRELNIDGAASAFSFHGESNLNDGEVDGELIVTLPVANNLPWVAALAGGPAVAAGVFVVSKVFEKQVNRMSSAVYQVSGPVDDPEVRFRRLFDDQPSTTPTATLPPEVP